MKMLSFVLRKACPVAVALLIAFATAFAASAADPKSKAPAKPLRILILGGTGFLGPATIDAALARGHKVTMFNRGRTRPELFQQVERLHGDRDPNKGDGLAELEKGEWDVVIDNSGQFPRHVKASAELLSTRSKHYIYISSISAYKSPNPISGEEDAPLATMPNPDIEEYGTNFENFGPLKALCEKAAEAAMPGRTAIIRPGFIVGPDDYSGRFAFWPVRFDKGGKIPVPGSPKDPILLVDVRDLGEWLVKLAENGTTGIFNAINEHKWGDVIEACVAASTEPKPQPIWVHAGIIAESIGIGVYPIWIPPMGDFAGFHRWSNKKAVEAGLKSRPILETVKDTLAWYKEQQKVENGRTRLAGPDEAAEAKVLNALKKDVMETLELLLK
jgi:2'-hydroxyisoflavone reductase